MPDTNPQSLDTTGLATDARGRPTIDPSKNVLDLVSAGERRQDDLREAESQTLRDLIAAQAKLFHTSLLAITERFSLVEASRKEQKVDTKTAVDAALSAAEKAVKEQTTASEKAITKSETAAAEQSKQQNATFGAALKGVVDSLSDVKERVGKVETQRQSDMTQHANSRLDLNVLIAIVAIAVAIIVAFAH